MNPLDDENFCGKPVRPLGENREARLAVPGEAMCNVSVHTTCLLPPGHDGPCKDGMVLTPGGIVGLAIAPKGEQ